VHGGAATHEKSVTDTAIRRVLLVVLAAGIAWSVLPVAASAERATTKGVFNVKCFFSHRAPDDPIVFPGVRGASHSHDFFGNVGTNADSTPDSLRRGATNCEHYAPSTGRRGDQAGYWVPTLYVNGLPVAAKEMAAYYTSDFRKTKRIVPFPPRLKMLAGPDPRHAKIGCATEKGTLLPGTATIAPTCAPGTPLIARIGFPDCWDGRRQDSRDHKSHMRYSTYISPTRYVCRGRHKVLVPKLQLEIVYDTIAGPTTRLASGDISTLHADFMNGWTMRKQRQLVNDCLVPDMYCGLTDGPVNPPRKKRPRRVVRKKTRPVASLAGQGHISSLICRL
jgi:Domain of unknown function (DUF1996)